MKIVDADTMQAIDRESMKVYGMPEQILMENAGRGVADALIAHFSDLPKKVTIIAGKGNNGGDGFVVARHLANRSYAVSMILLAKESELRGSTSVNANIWKKMGGRVLKVRCSADMAGIGAELRASSVLVDAIFGTGLSSNVQGIYADVINRVNSVSKPVLAVDLPSGIDASTGRLFGCAIKAKLTATMAMPKIGLFVYPGRSFSGNIKVIDIGIPHELLSQSPIRWNLIDQSMINGMMKARSSESHKGSYGHVLVIAGSRGKSGAAYLAAMGALRVGAGLVTLGVPDSLNTVMETKTTEIMTIPLPEVRLFTLGPPSCGAITEAMKGKSAVVLGPGIGAGDDLSRVVGHILETAEVPVILDADGINAISGDIDGMLQKCNTTLIMTPHPAEMSRLIGAQTMEVQGNRVAVASEFAIKYGVILILKGAGTIVAAPDGSVYINSSGNPALSTAGTGDVLSGIIGGLVGQGYTPLESSVIGVYIHGLSGDRIADRVGDSGIIASDLLADIPSTISFLKGRFDNI